MGDSEIPTETGPYSRSRTRKEMKKDIFSLNGRETVVVGMGTGGVIEATNVRKQTLF